jgi:DNA-binding beta-propeller fold protein YncE
LALLLLAVPSVSAFFSYRIIASYAALEQVVTIAVRELTYLAPPGEPIFHDGQGLAVASDGTSYAADLAGGRLLAFPPEGGGRGEVLSPRKGQEPLNGPVGVAVGSDDTVYLLELHTGVVRRYDRSGNNLGAVPLTSPGSRAIAVDDGGSIYVADIALNAVRRFRPDFQVDPSWGEEPLPGTTGVGEVGGLALLDGILYASEPRRREIVRLDRHGRILSRTPTRGKVGMLAASPDGRLYMSDISTNRVWVLDREGKIIGRVVGTHPTDSLFGQPRGVAIHAGNLYVLNDSRVTVYRLGRAGGQKR